MDPNKLSGAIGRGVHSFSGAAHMRAREKDASVHVSPQFLDSGKCGRHLLVQLCQAGTQIDFYLCDERKLRQGHGQ